MSSKIDSYVGPTVAAAAVRPVSRARDNGGSVVSQSPQRDETVALTGEARVLQQVEQKAQDDPGIDEAKVAETRRILAQGLYSADPHAIASRLMQLEWSLNH